MADSVPGGSASGNQLRWIHPGLILVATDLSDLARLIPIAFQMARGSGARLLLLHALTATESITADVTGMPYYDPTGAAEFAARSLDPCCQWAREKNIRCEAVIREGAAAEVILAVARQFRADRILLGTRSRGRLGRLLLGSVAERVLRSVDIPVVTVGPEAVVPEGAGGRGPTILYASALGEAARQGAALACGIASLHGAELVLLHVLPPVDERTRKGPPSGLEQAAIAELESMAADAVHGGGAKVVVRLAHGVPSIEILAEAAARHAGLIILGAARHSAFQNLTHDRTVQRVLAHARCPVLTLRAPAAQADRSGAELLALHL
jgi:nucleotide-binding universal stress UspA family protein